MAAVNELPTTIAYDHEDVRVEDKRDGKGIERATCSADVTELTVLNNFTTRYTQVSSRHLIITDPTGREHRLRHNPVGLLLREFANGTSELTRYDHEGRCLGRVAQRTDRVTWKRRFHYSAEGDLRKVEDNVYGTSSYVYDDAHRLIGENRADGTTNTIRYDEAGNILRKPGCEGVRMNSGNRIAAVNGQRFDYDHRNNLARREGGDSTTEYEYDSRDMLVRCRNGFGEWTAAYDPLSRRMWKEWDGHRVEYYWDGERLAAEVHDGAHTRVYIYPDDHALVPMIFMDYDAPDADPETGRAYFVFTDQLGTPVRIEDSNGTMVWAARVDPYGSVEINPQSTVSFALRFPGHYHDEETGLHYNRHRYYSPELGRYLQSDPVGQSGAVNVYAYPLNPLTEVDLEGLGCDGAANKGKAGVDAEEPKRNMWGRTDGQPKKYTATTKKGRREIAKRNGMDPEHLENVVARSKRTGETITFRGSNPASPRWHRNPHCTPKPVSMKHKTCKKKGDPREGLVVADDLSEADLKQLKKDGFKVNRDKTIVDKNGKYMYGDNDLQGVHKDGKPVDTNDPDWQDDFNDDMSGGDPKMVQHGANDQYKPKGEDGPMGRQPDNDESYVVVNPDGSVDEVQGTDALQDSQYGGHGQPDWPYDPYPPGKKKEKK
jgi:RHS repeat-associated protein